MIDIAALASSTIPFLTAYFSDTASIAVDASKKAVGNRIATWLTDKLKGSPEKAAIQKLEATPTSIGSQKSAEGAILTLLEGNPDLAAELSDILKSASSDDHSIHQKTTIKGHDNSITQIVGSKNKIRH